MEMSAKYQETNFMFEYSPESFTGTETDYALEVCNAVIDVWKPTPDHKVIINIPATVEMSTPNVYADQVEWFSRNIDRRDSVILSVHTHNDRGTSVAASELALLAGADRVEGTLFGNGERTGNVDILTMALNLYSQGIDPGVEIENVNEIIEVYERCTGLTVQPRQPYARELVYAAFSGSHQDAIRKGLMAYEEEKHEFWEVPYLPIDPSDVGRKYEAIIRINSQSGKGGVAYILENSYGYKLPKLMHPEIGKFVQVRTDETGRELTPGEIREIFEEKFVNLEAPMKLVHYSSQYADQDENEVTVNAVIEHEGVEKRINGVGNGPISAFFHGLQKIGFEAYSLLVYEEHAIQSGENAEAIAYIQLSNREGIKHFGSGRDRNIDKASIKALISSINKYQH